MNPLQFSLQLNPSTCILTDPQGKAVIIHIGVTNLAVNQFKGLIPTDLEIEYAIELIEECVMPLDKDIPRIRSILAVSNKTSDLNLEDILIKNRTLSVHEFEDIFNNTLFEKRSKYELAALLIIRECLHHLRFTKLSFI